MTWQPIETAPKDGTEIIVCGRYDEPCVVCWDGRDWQGRFQGMGAIKSEGDTWTDYHYAAVPMLWQPMPAAPTEWPD